MKFLTIFFVNLLVFGNSLKKPSYFQICSLSDPNLNQCALENAEKTYAVLKNGDSSLKLPPMANYKIEEIILNTGPNLKIKFTDIVIRGFENAIFKNIKADIRKNGKLIISGMSPRAIFNMNYDMDGRILVLPISGNGTAEIIYENCLLTMNIDIDIVEIKGKKYLKRTDSKCDYVAEKIIYKFNNLFNGDKTLGDTMNTFLNDNWRDIDKEVGGAVKESCNSIFGISVFNTIAKIPMDELFNP